MADSRVSNLANILVNYSTKVKPEDWVHIGANHIALPLVKEVVLHVLKAGGYPFVHLESGEINEVYLTHANEKQLEWIAPVEMQVIKNVDVSIFIEASENTRALSGIAPERQQKRQAAYREWFQIYMNRSANKDLRWVLTNYPCQAFAQDADMSLSAYEEFVYKATFADQDDPVGHWVNIHNEQQILVEWLAGKKRVDIRGKYADLSMSIDEREFINSDGDDNMPSGEIFTSPVEDSANGWVEFTYPAINAGREVEGVRLEFENGKAVKATAKKNETFLNTMLDIDEGARIIGELGIGTNFGISKFTKDILYDEKIGGSFHLALGKGFPEAGGKNQSSLHWDMICDAREDTEILVDGEIFYKDGKFQI
jgi:aminopeptidase